MVTIWKSCPFCYGASLAYEFIAIQMTYLVNNSSQMIYLVNNLKFMTKASDASEIL